MVIVWRSLLIICLPLLGFAAGMFAGRRLIVPRGQGLDHALTALGNRFSVALVFLLVAFVLAFKLPTIKLRKYALACTLLASIIYGSLIYQAVSKSAATREPDTAFLLAGNFTASMERLDIRDPYLFVKMEVDSINRKWKMTGPAPKHQICSAQLAAKRLIDIRAALDNLAAMNKENLVHCQTTDAAIKRLNWTIEGVRNSLDISTECVQNNYVVGHALALIENVSHSATTAVKCD
jgi:hypothetical protein